MQALIIFSILMMAVFTLSILYTRHYLHNLFEEFVGGAPLNARAIGEYDQAVRTNCPESRWRAPPSNKPLMESEKMFVPQGTPAPLDPVISTEVYSSDVRMQASVDENTLVALANDKKSESTQRSLFLFKNNQCSADCCPSSFSCSRGCVCTTKNQRDYLTRRGNNKNHPNEGF